MKTRYLHLPREQSREGEEIATSSIQRKLKSPKAQKLKQQASKQASEAKEEQGGTDENKRRKQQKSKAKSMRWPALRATTHSPPWSSTDTHFGGREIVSDFLVRMSPRRMHVFTVR
jgi:hypothetical protein